MAVARQLLMGVEMGFRILLMDMEVAVGVLMLVGVDQVPMPVGVGMDMDMAVGVLEPDAVPGHKPSAGGHNGQGGVKPQAGPVAQQQHTESHTQERGDGIIGAGFGRAQLLLRQDIEINAQTVGNKSQQQNRRKPDQGRKVLPQQQSDRKASRPGEAAFNRNDFYGAFTAEHFGAVVLKTPAGAGSQYKQRTLVEDKAAAALPAQKNAGGGHQTNGNP